MAVPEVVMHLAGSKLAEAMAQDLKTPGVPPLRAFQRGWDALLFEACRRGVGADLIKPPVVHATGVGSNRNRSCTLAGLRKHGLEIYYSEITYCVRLGLEMRPLSLTAETLELRPIQYGGGVERVYWLKTRTLKKQQNHTLRINHLVAPGAFFATVAERLMDLGGPEQPLVANFKPFPQSEWNALPRYNMRWVAFEHMLSGKRVFCSCAERAHRQALRTGTMTGIGLRKSSGELSGCEYVDGICHLCVTKAWSVERAVSLYGRELLSEYEEYIPQVALDLGVDRRTAKAELEQLFGLSRWAREATLYRLVRELFPDFRVLREASPDWLGRLRLDIYLPELGFALEHHGLQHYESVDAFGGEEAHQRGVTRDREKRELCAANRVDLFEIRYDAPLTKQVLARKLERFLEGR